MRYFDKQKQIEHLFLENGFSPKDFVVGTGNTFCNKKNCNRFEFNAREREPIIKSTAKYAVKYFAEHDIYIMWNVREWATSQKRPKRTIFSLDANDALEKYWAQNSVFKSVDLKNGYKEKVYVVGFEQLKEIIKKLSLKEHIK